MRSHSDRVGVLTWNSHTLTSGGRDSAIHNHDVRVSNHCVARYVHHKLEVCGLEWSPDGSKLASGGNDNLVCLWKNGSGFLEPQTVLTGHQAAVKVSPLLRKSCLCIHTCTKYPLTESLNRTWFPPLQKGHLNL